MGGERKRWKSKYGHFSFNRNVLTFEELLVGGVNGERECGEKRIFLLKILLNVSK